MSIVFNPVMFHCEFIRLWYFEMKQMHTVEYLCFIQFDNSICETWIPCKVSIIIYLNNIALSMGSTSWWAFIAYSLHVAPNLCYAYYI